MPLLYFACLLFATATTGAFGSKFSTEELTQSPWPWSVEEVNEALLLSFVPWSSFMDSLMVVTSLKVVTILLVLIRS